LSLEFKFNFFIVNKKVHNLLFEAAEVASCYNATLELYFENLNFVSIICQ